MEGVALAMWLVGHLGDDLLGVFCLYGMFIGPDPEASCTIAYFPHL